ncbi:MAG: hypothetical protein KJP02_12870 [Octadecabacter sp.]|nr:hypothetical protein [Octadecabacter sp.]
MRIQQILAAALVAAATPLAASADSCPTGADVDNGVRLTRLDPFFSVVFSNTASGLAEARVMQHGGTREAVDTVYSHALAVTSRSTPNGPLAITYDADPAALDELPALRRWDSAVTVTLNDAPFTTGSYTATVTGFGQATIGVCNYDVWRVRDLLRLDNGAVLAFEKSYAPALGLVVGSIQLDQQDQPAGSVFFDEITAE